MMIDTQSLSELADDAIRRTLAGMDFNLVETTDDDRYFRHRRTGELICVPKSRVREVI